MAKATLDEYHRAVGEVIRHWAQLEHVLVLTLQALMRTDQFRCRVIWDAISTFRARTILLKTLSNTYLTEPALTKFHSLLHRAEGLAEKRNMLAHSVGGLDALAEVQRELEEARMANQKPEERHEDQQVNDRAH
jgi:hypothetical protein